jgi:CRISPR/Cas system-associated exonuclease Cas4 (RecB family)
LLEETDNTEHRVKLRDDWIHGAIVCGTYAFIFIFVSYACIHKHQWPLKPQPVIFLASLIFSATGDLIHVICPNPREKIIVVDNEQNLLIIHPDTLISSTAVSDSFICVRRAVLRDRIRDTADYNEALVHGEILHKLFQSLIPGGDFSFDHVRAEMRRIVMASVEELYAIDQSEEKVLLILERYIPGMQAWAATYLTAEPTSHASVVTDRGPSFGHDRHQPVVVGIEKVLDIEEHIWSPMYGIKGMIDVTVQAKVKKGLNTQTLTIPLEIKTGVKSKILAHRAQTILYTLLMHDRYGK